MIYLLTDYGYQGPYLGQMHAVLTEHLSKDQFIDICHDLPRFDPRASAYLLPSFCCSLKSGDIVLAVVDPGVGSSRNPLWLTADNVHYVGPDNGLFSRVIQTAGSVTVRLLQTPHNASASFHGRDLFAPVAVQLVTGITPVCRQISVDCLQGLDCPQKLEEVIYIDSFGNAMLGIESRDIQENAIIEVVSEKLRYSRTFSEVHAGELFWYKNSMGLIELAKNSGSIASQLGLTIGSQVQTIQQAI